MADTAPYQRSIGSNAFDQNGLLDSSLNDALSQSVGDLKTRSVKLKLNYRGDSGENMTQVEKSLEVLGPLLQGILKKARVPIVDIDQYAHKTYKNLLWWHPKARINC